jgi:DNA-directed RNA polymerase specialized sigma24 family protein
MENMTAWYREYRNGRIGAGLLEAKIMREIARRSRLIVGNSRAKPDMDMSDFLSWIYPRIHSAVANYADRGFSFESYVCSIVRSAYREYRAKEHDHAVTEMAVWTEKASECAAEKESEYPAPEEDARDSPFVPVPNPRQVLILLLKSYNLVSDRFIARIAPALGLNPSVVERLIAELREIRSEKEDEIHDLKERVHCQYYRCLSLRRRSVAAIPGSARQSRHTACLERAEKRLGAMRERLRHMGMDATNQEVAEVLGITKGTVDASLFSLKKHYGGDLSGPDDSAPPQT